MSRLATGWVMLKRFGIFLYIIAVFALGENCFAQSQFSAVLTRMEKSLFGVDYSTQADEARLKRIEEVVYGQISSSSLQSRVDKLSKDLSADLIGQEIKPKADSFEDEAAGVKEEPIPQADTSVNYPIVNSMEQKIFSKEFRSMDINKRLANLEKNVFQKTYGDDLNSRVDRLKVAIMPGKVAQTSDSEDEDYSNTYSPPDIETLIPSQNDSDDYSDTFTSQGNQRTVPSYNSKNSVLDEYQNDTGSDSDISVPLAALETTVLRRSYPNDITTNRLTRLELKVFNSTFVDDDPQSRLDRIASAYQAKKSSAKYDSNRFQKRMATAMQVGAVLLMILAAVL